MKINRFEDIVVWQKSKNLATIIYKLFKTNSDYSFRDQIQRAVISISNNIAEGFERKSNKELTKFLFIAKGSCAELRSMMYIAKELGYVNEKNTNEILENCEEISRMISGFIKSIM